MSSLSNAAESATKQDLESLSIEMGLGGEITDVVMAAAGLGPLDPDETGAHTRAVNTIQKIREALSEAERKGPNCFVRISVRARDSRSV